MRRGPQMISNEKRAASLSEAPPANTPIDTLTILGIPVHMVTMTQLLRQVEQFMAGSRVHQIVTTNPEFVMAAQKDDAFRQLLHEADLSIPDGVGLLWASRWLRNPLVERVPGSELVFRLAELSAKEGWRLFLLGAAPGVAEEAAAQFQAVYPELSVAGTYAGSPDPTENEEIVRRINESGADILFVAYGAPRQDKWIARNRAGLKTVRLAMGVGGALDFVSGRVERAPKWAQDLGLEWLYRLGKEPWRWRRMLALPHFALKVLLGPRS